MANRVEVGQIKVAKELYDFINSEVLPGSGVDEAEFWSGLDQLLHEMGSKNDALLAKRDDLQSQIDQWHLQVRNQAFDLRAYTDFLKSIGYLLEEGPPFTVETKNVDDEIAKIPGPQLVVPLTNARYALNAANARWVSLYDALYGTDAIPEEDGAERTGGYNPVRGERVIAWGRKFLDAAAPLEGKSHADVTAYSIKDGVLHATTPSGATSLKSTSALAGYQGDPTSPNAIILTNNSLHIL